MEDPVLYLVRYVLQSMEDHVLCLVRYIHVALSIDHVAFGQVKITNLK